MAIIEDHLRYLKDPERYPKVNRKKIIIPNGQFSGTEYNRIIETLSEMSTTDGKNVSFVKYTPEQYYDLRSNGLLKNCLYTVYKDGELYRVYIGETLVMRRKTEDEAATNVSVFPLVFPIIFP